MTDFDGRIVIVIVIVIVTGAANGIGEATALTFARAGALVIAVDRDTDRLRDVEEAIRGAGGEVVALVADVREDEQVHEVVRHVVTDYGRMGLLHG